MNQENITNMHTVYSPRNVSMVMDFYELTMAYGYFVNGDLNTRVAFDVFYRKNPDQGGFAIFAGLEQIVEYIQGFHFSSEDMAYLEGLGLFSEAFLEYLKQFRFQGDIYAFPEGTIMYPNEPVLTVVAPVIDAQLIETGLLTIFNHQSLIATKARRITKAADGRAEIDFGARRAQGFDAATYGARAAMIGGAAGTATVSAAQMMGEVPKGTMAHSWIMRFPTELEAFRAYAQLFPRNCVLLVDTYDVLKSGVPNAIRIFQEMKEQGTALSSYGIRLDSGDLAYLSRHAREMLDQAGFTDAKITVSNSLDEYTIESLLNQGACIDSFGVGERQITAKSDPVFGGVYKLSAVEENGKLIPRIKISEAVEKITNPGLKEVYRIYDENGRAVADMIAGKEEIVDLSKPFRYVDPEKPWKNRFFDGFTAQKLQIPVFIHGEFVGEKKAVREIAAYVKKQLAEEIWEEEQRFENPHKHYLDMTPDYYDQKMSLLHDMEEKSH